jgi:hypothetical protein
MRGVHESALLRHHGKEGNAWVCVCGMDGQG